MIAYIYAIKNVVNNKMYIGSTKSPKSRKPDHFWYLKKGKHHSYHLQQSYNKYGKDKFFFYILEECNIDIRKERELYYISFYKSFDRDFGYNIYEPNSDKFKCSEETKQKLKDANIKINRSVNIDIYDIKNKSLINSYESISEASRSLNIYTSILSELLHKKRKSYKGIIVVKRGDPFDYIESPMTRNMIKFYK